MTTLEVGLVAAIALLTVLVVALLRTQAATAQRLTLLERKVQRDERRPPAGGTTVGPQGPGESVGASLAPEAVEAVELEGDAVDIRGVSPDGAPLTVPLELSGSPTLLAFLSTSCGTCTSMWAKLRDGDLAAEVDGITPVVVTKDADREDVDRIRSMVTDAGALTVVLSSEAWNDYEVPASPYVMIVSAAPGSVVSEGSVTGWGDIVRMAATVTSHAH